MTSQPAHLIVGDLVKPHGIKGELFVAPMTDDVGAVFQPGRTLQLGDANGRPLGRDATLTVAAVRQFKGGLIVRFADIADRNVAEGLRGRSLLIPVDEAPPLQRGEYYLHDLVGLQVVGLDGSALGRVSEIYEGGPGHLLGVYDGTRERLIPFSSQIVREVDVDGGRIVIDPPPGLLSL